MVGSLKSTPNKENVSGNVLAESHGEEIPGLNRSLWSLLSETVAHSPDKEAVVSLWQTPYEDSAVRKSDQPNGTSHPTQNTTPATPPKHIRWTYTELHQKVEHLASWLHAHGCVKGQNLVVLVWNSAEWALFFWVAARLKMPFIPLDPRTVNTDATHYIGLLEPYVIVVPDGVAASALQKTTGQLDNAAVQISCSSLPVETKSTWHALPSIFSAQDNTRAPAPLEDDGENPGADISMILFTSGTTSLPKGCPHTATNIWSQSYDFDPVSLHPLPLTRHRTLLHTPAWHSFAINQALRGFRAGNAIVFPSPSFDVQASLKAMEHERITYMAVVPALAQALVAHPGFPGKERLGLKYVSIGSTVIKESDVRFCKDKLGAEAVVQGFGLTEGIPVASWLRADEGLVDGWHPAVGKVLPGARLKVCEPGSRRAVERGEVGELHVGGTSVIGGYYGGVGKDAFYNDEVGNWFMTGDQARMDRDGAIYILGRYKDLIIRGGKNIAPAKIEQCLQENGPVIAQVVGMPDSVAGEVPVAVVLPRGDFSKSDLTKAVEERLGKEYALDAVVTLEELGLKQFPMTSVGKIRKNVLKEHVIKLLGQEEETKPAEPSVTDKLVAIWSELLNIPPEKISTTEPVSKLGDSITILRFCERVWRKLGKRLFLTDFAQHQNIEQQAELLSTRSHGKGVFSLGQAIGTTSLVNGNFASKVVNGHASNGIGNGAPSLDDVPFLNNDPDVFEQMAYASSEVLGGFGLSWETDVEDIIPIKDSLQRLARGPRPQSYRHRIAFEIPKHQTNAVRAALETALGNRPMYRTLLVTVYGNTSVHVVVRPSDTLYNHLITETTFANVEEAKSQLINDDPESFSQVQMFHATIGSIEDANSAAVIFTFNHSCFDALSVTSFYTDFDRLLADPSAAPMPLTPFKQFTDLLHQQRHTPLYKKAITYHSSRLRALPSNPLALWPPRRSPGWMIGSGAGSPVYVLRDESGREHGLPQTPYPRLIRIRTYAQLETLRTQHGVPASIVAKTALAIFNTLQTGQSHAVFSNIEAGRTWPFVPKWMQACLPSPMSIDGPTLTWMVNVIGVSLEETIGELLQRVMQDQEKASEYVHAPWFEVVEALGERREDMLDKARRQMFNWDLSLRYLWGDVVDHTELKALGRMDWPDSGFFWNCGMVTKEQLCVVASWDDAQVTEQEAEGYVLSLLDIIGWLAEPDNWGKSVGEVHAASEKDASMRAK